MAVNIELLKEIASINYNQDDRQLQLFLDSSREQVERWTNISLHANTVTFIARHKETTVNLFPIESITGATKVDYCGFETIIHAKVGDTITIEVSDSNNKILEDVVYRLALSRYDNKEIDHVNLPLNYQMEINQFRRDSFIS